MSDRDAIVVLCSCPTAAVAERLATGLVGARLAACVSVVPGMTSVYRWEGQVQSAQEVLMVIKTSRTRYPAIENAIVKDHPYEVPEIIAVGIDAGLAKYLQWISDSTSRH